VYATGPFDAYAMHLPVAVRDPLEWLSFWIVSQQISVAAATAIFGRLMTALGGGFSPERVIAADDAALLGAGCPGTSRSQAPDAALPRPARRRSDPNPTIFAIAVALSEGHGEMARDLAARGMGARAMPAARSGNLRVHRPCRRLHARRGRPELAHHRGDLGEARDPWKSVGRRTLW
jgi:hypothetical protein